MIAVVSMSNTPAVQQKSPNVKNVAKRHDVYSIARQCGVRLYNGSNRYKGSRGNRDCFSAATLRKIASRHGAGHLALVLRLIVETKDNAAELYAETITALSALMEYDPMLVEKGGQLFDLFDEIDLKSIRKRARAMRSGVPVSHIIRILILHEIQNLDPRVD